MRGDERVGVCYNLLQIESILFLQAISVFFGYVGMT